MFIRGGIHKLVIWRGSPRVTGAGSEGGARPRQATHLVSQIRGLFGQGSGFAFSKLSNFERFVKAV